jgi:hypothetical protein
MVSNRREVPMTARTAIICVVVATATAALLSQANVSGTWDLEMRWPDGSTSGGLCVFDQKGDAVSGTCGGEKERFPVTGRAAGGDVSWEVEIKQGGADAVMEYSGKIGSGGTTIAGTCRIVGVQGGTFTMRRRT